MVDASGGESDNLCVSHHQTNAEVAGTAFTRIAVDSPAANHRPAPAPGFRAAGASLFYVTPRGRTWLVRSESTVQLTPATIPDDSVDVEDEVEDSRILAAAETADVIESASPGVYVDSDLGLYYVVTYRAVLMVYGVDLSPVTLPELPPDAVAVDVIPKHLRAAVTRMQEREESA